MSRPMHPDVREYMDTHGVIASVAATHIWKIKHPDKSFEQNRRTSSKKKLTRTLKTNEIKGFISVGREREIMKHHGKGRSVGDIVCWMNMPASKIIQVLKANGVENPK